MPLVKHLCRSWIDNHGGRGLSFTLLCDAFLLLVNVNTMIASLISSGAAAENFLAAARNCE